jgi:hypothetical protein
MRAGHLVLEFDNIPSCPNQTLAPLANMWRLFISLSCWRICRQNHAIQNYIPSFIHLLFLSFDKLQGLLPRHHANRARFPFETDAIALLSHKKHFWAESGADELSG